MMTKQYMIQYAIDNGFALNIKASSNIIPQKEIDKRIGRSTLTPKQIFQEIADYPFGRTGSWGFSEIADMYLIALANGATFEQCDASCQENYGMDFGTLYNLYLFSMGY